MLNKLELIVWIVLDAIYYQFNLKTFNKLYKYKEPFNKRLVKKYGYIMKGIETYNLLLFFDITHYGKSLR